MRQVSKTSISYETSSKSHTSSLQNERFVRDFLKKSHVKSPKRAFRKNERFVRDFLQKSSGNTHRSTHTSRSPAKQFRDYSPSKQHPPTRQSQCDSDIHLHLYHNSNLTIPCTCHKSFRVHTSNAHKVLRLPRNVTSVTPRNLTIPCACHKNRTSTPQNSHKVLRLPRKVTILCHVSFNKICTTPHVWNDFDPF